MSLSHHFNDNSIGLSTLVMLINASWHFLAGWHFLLFPYRTIGRYFRFSDDSKARSIDRCAAELMRFLGGLNFAICLLAAVSLLVAVEPQWVMLSFFAAANFSQFAIDVYVHRAGLTNSAFLVQILGGDALVTVLNTACVLFLLSKA